MSKGKITSPENSGTLEFGVVVGASEFV